MAVSGFALRFSCHNLHSTETVCMDDTVVVLRLTFSEHATHESCVTLNMSQSCCLCYLCYCERGPIPVLRYVSDVTIWCMPVSVTASTWRMLELNYSAPSPPSCHWICPGVIYRTREWQHLATIHGSVTSHLLNVQISLTWDYRCVWINSHASRRGRGGAA